MANSGEGNSCESCRNIRKHECNNAVIDSGFCRNAVGGWQPKTKESGEIRADVFPETQTRFTIRIG